MKRVISLILFVLSSLVLLFGIILFFLGSERRSPAASGAEVREEVKAIQTLASSEYRYREVVYYGEQARLLGIPAGRREVLFSVDIVVRAGIDLTRGFEVEIDPREKTVYLTLPAAEILLVDAKEDSIQQYFSTERLGRLDWLDVGEELSRAKAVNRNDAIERGILSAAEEQARSVLDDLIRASGFDTVEVRFRRSTELRG